MCSQLNFLQVDHVYQLFVGKWGTYCTRCHWVQVMFAGCFITSGTRKYESLNFILQSKMLTVFYICFAINLSVLRSGGRHVSFSSVSWSRGSHKMIVLYFNELYLANSDYVPLPFPYFHHQKNQFEQGTMKLRGPKNDFNTPNIRYLVNIGKQSISVHEGCGPVPSFIPKNSTEGSRQLNWDRRNSLHVQNLRLCFSFYWDILLV